MSAVGLLLLSVSLWAAPLRTTARLRSVAATGQPAGACAEMWRRVAPGRAYLATSWRRAGRPWVVKNSGFRFDSATNAWYGDSQHILTDNLDVGQEAYTISSVLEPAVQGAIRFQDHALMNELAEFYLAYAVHFKASKLLRSPAPFSEGKGDGSHDRFLPSFNGSRRATIVECVLCSAQFLHPASSLILAIAKLPPQERTPELNRFVALYSPLIVHEHLIRWMSHSNRNYWRAPDLDSAYLDVWRRLAAPEVAHRHNYKYAVVDTDLWEIAMAAELLAANKTAPEVVPVSAPDRRMLRDIVRVGVAMMRSRMAMHPDTRDFAGSVVGSIGMFEGDFNGYPDVRFAGETNEQLPATPAPLPATLSWDVSHATRIPRVIESLRRAQSSLGFTTFTDDEIRRLANQYLYRVFQGDYAHPRLANFFDGSDGWYRVGYHGPGFGYPPSRFCDSRAGSHPCLETFGVTGWGLLSNTNPELCSLYDALVKLASANDSSSRDYADRYFTFQGEPFARSIGNENGQYPLLLFIILSDNAASLR